MNRLSAVCLALMAVATMGRPSLPPVSNGPPAMFPPGFESVLPQEAKDQLVAVHRNPSLSFDERRDAIEQVFDSLPTEILRQLPLPPGIERLPDFVKEKFRALQLDRSLSGQQRHERVQALLRDLSDEHKRLVAPPPPPAMPPMPPQFPRGFNAFPQMPSVPQIPKAPMVPMMPMNADGFPARPPPGFEFVLAPTVFAQLLKVHEDSSLDTAAKRSRIDVIMREVPQEQLDRLPLPPGFDRLPATSMRRARALMHDFSIGWEERHARVQEFIRSLPKDERRLLRPPMAAGLPEEAQEELDAIFENEKLEPMERQQRVAKVFARLPIDFRSRPQERSEPQPDA